MRFITKADFQKHFNFFKSYFLFERSDRTVLIEDFSLGEKNLIGMSMNCHVIFWVCLLKMTKMMIAVIINCNYFDGKNHENNVNITAIMIAMIVTVMVKKAMIKWLWWW